MKTRIDCGAVDYRRGSETYAFDKRGWNTRCKDRSSCFPARDKIKACYAVVAVVAVVTVVTDVAVVTVGHKRGCFKR